MNALEAAVLGLVEGITEYLPVSSTGHLILTSALMYGPQSDDHQKAMDTFAIVIQGGAILAVLGLYWPRVVQMLRGLIGKDAAGMRLLINLFIAFLPAAVVGLKLHDRIEATLFRPVPVLGALAVGGVLMILVGRWQRRVFHENVAASTSAAPRHDHQYRDIDSLTWKEALIIGCFQCLSLWPGTSRSMVTILGGMFIGLKPRQSAEFSFLLALPTLGAACAYKALKNHHELMSLGAGPMAIGVLVAMLSAALAVKFLVGFLNRHGLAMFGWYRLALCAVMAMLIWRGTLQIEPQQKTIDSNIPASDH